jgi:hypothetical protein
MSIGGEFLLSLLPSPFSLLDMAVAKDHRSLSVVEGSKGCSMTINTLTALVVTINKSSKTAII